MKRGRIGYGVFAGQLLNRFSSKRFAARNHFVKDYAEAVDVGSSVDVVVACRRSPLFRRHIKGGAEQLSAYGKSGYCGAAQVGHLPNFCKAKIKHFNNILAARRSSDHYVFRFEIAVNHSDGM